VPREDSTAASRSSGRSRNKAILRRILVVVAVALANKMSRTTWALLAKGGT
jgi:hypothetical protein